MRTFDEILRRCLSLARQLTNEPFKAWIELELNGYSDGKPLPDYRFGGCVAKRTRSYPSCNGHFAHFAVWRRAEKRTPKHSACRAKSVSVIGLYLWDRSLGVRDARPYCRDTRYSPNSVLTIAE